MAQLAGTIAHRVCRHLVRRGWLEGEGESAYLSDNAAGEEGMDALRMSSITYRIATGAQAGRKVTMLQTLPGEVGFIEGAAGKVGGFSLHAGVVAEAHEGAKLERLCRYIARPALSEQRLSISPQGRVRYALKTPWRQNRTPTVSAKSYTDSRQSPTVHARAIGDAAPMTQARSALIAPGSPGTFHCVQRCVRRAWLCGDDQLTGQSFEHRKGWIEQRLALLGECFAIAIHAYAVMSNHLHVVVQIVPPVAAGWDAAEVAARWVRLFPPREATDDAWAAKAARIVEQPERLALLRRRLCDLSWLMRCLAEPIARRANVEDDCKGRFWEGRFKAQVLCDARAVLAAMAYVDLNPVRAGVAGRLEDSEHTSIKARLESMQKSDLSQPLVPLHGVLVATCLPITLGGYLALVAWTGQQVRPDKRGALDVKALGVLAKFEARPERWAVRVKAIGSGYWRVVGEVADLMDTARQLGQRWLKGVGLAAGLAKAD